MGRDQSERAVRWRRAGGWCTEKRHEGRDLAGMDVKVRDSKERVLFLGEEGAIDVGA